MATEASEPEPTFAAPDVDPSSFRRAMRLKAELQRTFAGRTLDDLYVTDVLEGDYGTCLEIRHREPLDPSWPAASTCRGRLQGTLRLLHGVGPRVEVSLHRAGYTSLGDLTDHPRWGAEAERVLDCLHDGPLADIHRLLRRLFPASHPLNLDLLALTSPRDLAFLDLESLGLFGRPVVLLGLARFDEHGLDVRQLVARDITEELPALAIAAERLGQAPIWVTYNGRAFDANMLRERLDYYGLFPEFEPIHLDMLPHARRRFRGTIPDARLESVERQLGRAREIDLPSALVPDFYNTYSETDNIGPLVPILEHNKHDVLTLTALLQRLLQDRTDPAPDGRDMMPT